MQKNYFVLNLITNIISYIINLLRIWFDVRDVRDHTWNYSTAHTEFKSE